jgi:translation initiation factor IF-2
MPVEVLGFEARPIRATSSPSSRTKRAPARSPIIASAPRDKASSRPGLRSSLDQMMQRSQRRRPAGGGRKPLLVKGDVQGSVEAITGALEKLGTTRSEPASCSRAPARSPRAT